MAYRLIHLTVEYWADRGHSRRSASSRRQGDSRASRYCGLGRTGRLRKAAPTLSARKAGYVSGNAHVYQVGFLLTAAPRGFFLHSDREGRSTARGLSTDPAPQVVRTRQFAAQGQVERSAATRFSAGDLFQSRGGTAAGMIALSMIRSFPQHSSSRRAPSKGHFSIACFQAYVENRLRLH